MGVYDLYKPHSMFLTIYNYSIQQLLISKPFMYQSSKDSNEFPFSPKSLLYPKPLLKISMAENRTYHSSLPPLDLMGIIAINVVAQLSIKLNSSNFPSGKAQFDALLYGYHFMGFLDGNKTCPCKQTTAIDGTTISNPYFAIWTRQDKLLIRAILASILEGVVPLIATATSSHDAWVKLHKLYANKSRSRAINLKKKLTNITRNTRSIEEYLQTIEGIADELALTDTHISDDDLTIFALNGLSSGFKIFVALRARDTLVSFEELHAKLIEHEAFLKREESHGGLNITVNSTHTSFGNHQSQYGNGQSNNGKRFFNNRNHQGRKLKKKW